MAYYNHFPIKFWIFGVSRVNPIIARSHTAQSNYIRRPKTEAQTQNGFEASHEKDPQSQNLTLTEKRPANSDGNMGSLSSNRGTQKPQQLLHTKAFTQSSFYPKNAVYTEKLLHTSHLPLSAEPSALFSQLQSAHATLAAAP